MRTARKAFWAIMLVCTFFVCAGAAYAGTGYEVKCKDPKCGFETQAAIGGGMAFEEAAGFCPRCGEWVSVTWKRGKKAPRPFAKFWDPKTGEVRQLYKCPKCKEPFVVIENIEDMRFCPRCKEPSLEYKSTIMYD